MAQLLNVFELLLLIEFTVHAIPGDVGNDPTIFRHPYADQQRDQRRLSKPFQHKEIHKNLKRDASESEKRLPNVLRPTDYYLRMQPYYPAPGITIPPGRNFTFDAMLTMVFRVIAPTANLTVHAVNLTVISIALYEMNNAEENGSLNITSWQYDAKLSHLIIHPRDAPIVGRDYMLQFAYTGLINYYEDAGLFYTSYTDQNRDTQCGLSVFGGIYMIATHFEDDRARKVFPCCDEPAYKAVFHLQLIYPSAHVPLGNMLETTATPLGSQNSQFKKCFREKFSDGWSFMQFPPTPAMSTYLVAFASGPFVSQSVVNQAGTVVRAWVWEGMEKTIETAAQYAARLLDELGKYTNSTFPLKKSDQLALPQFEAGAMENWGLVIYDADGFLSDQRSQITEQERSQAEVEAHELAHQWFGDIVTMAWWSDLFLNEGFARFFQHYAIQLAYPEQQLYFATKFVPEVLYRALVRDGDAANSHPVSTNDADNFDRITYDKGASLLRMLNFTLGADVFQLGLQIYIKQHQYGNANHEDLWSALTTAAQIANLTDWCNRPLNVSNFMDPWILQQGFPVISVVTSDSMAPAKFVQRPFNDLDELPPSPYNYSWPVPLFTASYLNGNAQLRWLAPEYDYCKTNPVDPVEGGNLNWELANADARSFIRIEYDDASFARILQQLQQDPDSLSVESKAQLIGDALEFLNRQQECAQPFSYERLLSLTDIIAGSNTNYAPIFMVLRFLPSIERVFQLHSDYVLFERFIQRIFMKAYKCLDWIIADDWDANAARFLVLPYAVRYDFDDAGTRAMTFFQQLQSACHDSNATYDCNPIHPDIRPAVYCGAAKIGGEAVFDALLSYYTIQIANATSTYLYDETNALLYGLSCAQDESSIIRYVQMIMKDESYPNDANGDPFDNLQWNRKTSPVMLDFINGQGGSIVLSSGSLGRFLYCLTYNWYSPTHLDMYRQMNATLNANAILTSAQRRTIERYYSKVQDQVSWSNEYASDITRWLHDHFAPNASTQSNEQIVTATPPLFQP